MGAMLYNDSRQCVPERTCIVEKVVKKFENFAEAGKADIEFYRSLTGEQRLEILLELITRGNANASQRLERVYRIIELEKR